jgi:hypothetical protein
MTEFYPYPRGPVQSAQHRGWRVREGMVAFDPDHAGGTDVT